MTATPFVQRRRKNRLTARTRTHSRLTILLLSLLTGVLSLLTTLTLLTALAYAYISAGLPDPAQLPILLHPQTGILLQPTRLYDRSGQHVIAVLAPQDARRPYIPIDPAAPAHLPAILARSTVELLDPGFWTHPGFVLQDLADPEKHPTLSQKLVYNILLWDEPAGLRRALRERLLAAQLTSRYGREKILEWYLNTASYAHFAYGAEAASLLYLGKPVATINLAEAALLAAINESPAINPFDAPRAALQRQADMLNQLQARGIVTADAASQARSFVIKFIPAPTPAEQPAPAFTALSLSQLDQQFNRAGVELGGMQINTTLDYDLQLRAECALQTQFQRLSVSGNLSAPQTCTGSEALPPLPSGEAVPQSASAVVIDPRSGQVLALLGDSTGSSASAFLTPQRPGTSLLPFVYLTGFTRGLSPASLVWDLPDTTGAASSPHTALGPMRLRTAMTGESLSTASQIFDQMSASLVQQTLAPFGLQVNAANLQALIDTDDRFSVMQLARAYGILANQGTLSSAAPLTILSVTRLDGQLYHARSSPASEQIVSPQLAALLTDVLSVNIPELARPVSFRIGQTADNAGTWAAGYTPYRTVVTWMGGDSLSTRPVYSVWQALMQLSSEQQPPDNWTLPPGMLRLKVCDPSGMLPTPACPNTVDELFIDGFQPTQTDTLFKSVEINQETGLLATVFTPRQLVQEKVFMQVPPEALTWARTKNLPDPPTQYDSLLPPLPNPLVNISSPAMLQELSGTITISGTAASSGFSYYRLQFGQGMNPRSWTQIGGDTPQQVNNNTLAAWDTSGLNGLYCLQLLVVNHDLTLQTATVQLTIHTP